MGEQFEYKRISQFPIAGFEEMKRESIQEGFNFLRRLEEDWTDGSNQFSKQGEGLYAIVTQNQLIAIGGINIDPYTNEGLNGRLRRFYILKSCRRQGIGKRLLNFIVSAHQSHFQTIHLYTDNPTASDFYIHFGFKPVHSHPKISHQLLLVKED